MASCSFHRLLELNGYKMRIPAARGLLFVLVFGTIIAITLLYGGVFTVDGRVQEKDLARQMIVTYPHPPYARSVAIVQDAWQDVPGSKEKLFVYSAFFERRGAFKLRVVGASSRLVEETVWCHLWYGEVPSVTVKATLQIIREHHFMNYSACFIFCPLHTTFPVPDSVSIVTDPSSMPANRLAVIDNNPALLDRPKNLAVCVKPLFEYDNIIELIEFLELYKIMGVDKVVIYAHTVSPRVHCALDVYAETDDVAVFPWHLDLVSQVEVRSEGIFASLNECLYRYMYRYSNMVVVDLDEYIVPHKMDSLVDMVGYLDTEYDAKKTVGSYMFKNAFFYLNWPQYPSTVDTSDSWLSRLHSTSKLRRKMTLERYTLRSKYIFKPERVVELGNHFVWEHLPDVKEVRVAPNVGLSQHYRVCELENDRGDCSGLGSKVDKTALRYQERLLKRVKEKWDLLKRRCDFPDIADVDNSSQMEYKNYSRGLQ